MDTTTLQRDQFIDSQRNALLEQAYRNGRGSGTFVSGSFPTTGIPSLDAVRDLSWKIDSIIEGLSPGASLAKSTEAFQLIGEHAGPTLAAVTAREGGSDSLVSALNQQITAAYGDAPLTTTERAELAQALRDAFDQGYAEATGQPYEGGLTPNPDAGNDGTLDPYIEALWTEERLRDLEIQIEALISTIAYYIDQMFDLEHQIEELKRNLESASEFASPLILDLDGNGIQTTGLSSRTYFDHAADGFAERTGWVGPGDGLLVWDRDGNGQIDSGRELFGSETLLASGLKAVNGFAALTELDSNGDGVIDANDPVFAQLRVWVDANGNGRTDEGDLLTLEEAGVHSIHLGYAHSSHVDEHGNAHKQIGSFTTNNGETREVADVWFKTDPAYSIPTEWLAVPEHIAALPNARGYGNVHDLQQVMVRDEVLTGRTNMRGYGEVRDPLSTSHGTFTHFQQHYL